jgi:hypothetical protein
MSQKCHSILHDKNGRLLAEIASVSADQICPTATSSASTLTLKTNCCSLPQA